MHIAIGAIRPVNWSKISWGNKVGDRMSVLPIQQVNSALPVITIHVNRTPCSALLDSPCSQSILCAELCQYWSKQDVAVTTLIGAKQACCSSDTI